MLLSKLLVASSNITIFESLKNILANAILCLCPPESLIPLSPTIVLYLSSRLSIKLCNSAFFAALYISSFVASGLAILILS